MGENGSSHQRSRFKCGLYAGVGHSGSGQVEVVCGSAKSTLNEAGDFLFPKKEGAINDDHIKGEVGEVLLGKVQGRKSADEITLFKSLGLAVEDVASAHHIYTKALQRNMGIAVRTGRQPS